MFTSLKGLAKKVIWARQCSTGDGSSKGLQYRQCGFLRDTLTLELLLAVIDIVNIASNMALYITLIRFRTNGSDSVVNSLEVPKRLQRQC
jgi:hypothetical protein